MVLPDTYWNRFKNKTKSYVNKHNAWSTNKYNQHIIKQNKKALINRLNSHLKLDDDLAFTMNSSDDDIIKAINKLESKKNLGQFPYSEYPSKTGSAALDFFGKTFGAKDLSFDQAANYYMKTKNVENWSPDDITNKSILSTTKRDPEWLQKMAAFEPDRYASYKGDVTWNPVSNKFENIPGGDGPIYYPGYTPNGMPTTTSSTPGGGRI